MRRSQLHTLTTCSMSYPHVETLADEVRPPPSHPYSLRCNRTYNSRPPRLHRHESFVLDKRYPRKRHTSRSVLRLGWRIYACSVGIGELQQRECKERGPEERRVLRAGPSEFHPFICASRGFTDTRPDPDDMAYRQFKRVMPSDLVARENELDEMRCLCW